MGKQCCTGLQFHVVWLTQYLSMGQNLKQVSENLKTLNDTTEAGKSLWQTGAEVFKAIASWLGIAAAVLGI